MDLMESVTLELRPRLRVVNTYIRYKNNQNNPSISVKIVENSVILQMDDKTIRLLLNSLKIIPVTLSTLMITDNWISFRIQTNPADCQYGSFQAEVLNNSERDDRESFITPSSSGLPQKNSPISFHCANCQAPISKQIEFNRVLPLPRNDCDPSDWFCCKHSDNATNFSLTPNDKDYFYGSYYFVLNKTVFISQLKIGDYVRCQRCFSVLGIKKDIASLKLWNSSVEKHVNDLVTKASEPFDDFLLAIKESIGPQIGQRVLLESSEQGLFKYLFLKPMEMKLDLLTETDFKNRDNQDTISLTELRVMKVMYIYGESDETLKETYLEDKYCQVGSSVLAAGLDHLLLASNRFPPNYRIISGWYMGYIVLPDMSKFFV